MPKKSNIEQEETTETAKTNVQFTTIDIYLASQLERIETKLDKLLSIAEEIEPEED